VLNYFFSQIDISKLSRFLRSGKIEEELEIIKADMDEDLLHTIKRLTLDALKTNNSLSVICSELNESLITRVGGNWNFFVYKRFFGNFHVRNLQRKYILFNIADMNFVIFQTSI